MLVLIIIISMGILLMSILSHFNLDSDYTAPKEAHSFDQTLSVGATSVSSYNSVTRTLNVTVPNGVYFENTTITLSASGETSPTPFIVYIRDLGSYNYYQIVAGLRKTSNSQYQIYATIQNLSSSTRTIPAFTVRVKCHLFVSAQ